MKIITLEEHFLNLDIAKASAANSAKLTPWFNDAFDHERGAPYSPSAEQLLDVDDVRLADMDANGITTQVLSVLTAQLLPADVAVDLVKASNDWLAATVERHPGRYAGFAALPTIAPEAAADELERSITELGFVGTMINGRTEDLFLDEPKFDPVLERAARLDVPIYLHPAAPPLATSNSNYAGLENLVTTRFETVAWGWHQETAVHFLHLVLSGTFDKYPNLQFVLGHWGEMIPFFLERLDEAMPKKTTGLDRTMSEYLRENMHVTPSGMFSQAQLQFCIELLGVDRIMYAVDYPFVSQAGAADFLENANLSNEDKEKIAHVNAEKLFGL
ncbi:amidohydrolase family protein [Subtercola lobariae]|uniref:Amidohydrolase-related domain-containing protein n=1 Tax=Subtercola lobariae TaxID=1588641 RepID=A0A917B3P3_9MICO|nr:amidohydrolase family protein [Subtercola lobariae]GGF17514.1 hypothetical protein GCM10011399_09080 [Subtercola lobariae]